MGSSFRRGGGLEQENVVIVPDEAPSVVAPKTTTQSDRIVVLTDEEENRQATRRFSTIILSAIILIFLVLDVFGYFIVRDKMAASRKDAEARAQYACALENEGKRLAGEYGKLKAEDQKLNVTISETREQLKNAKTQARAQQDINASLRAKITELEALLAEVKAAYARSGRMIREKEQMLQRAKALGPQKDAAIKDCLEQIAHHEARTKALKDEIAQHEACVKALKAEVAKLRDALADAERRQKAEEGQTKVLSPEPTPKRVWYQCLIFW